MIDPPARVLVVTDLSAAGDVALVAADCKARATGAQLAIVHAIPTIDAIRPLFPQRVADDAILASQIPIHAEAALRARLETLGVTSPHELFVEEGATADVALAVIERWQPTLVVLGSPADGAIGTVGIVRHATMPVLVARDSPATRRVVAGTDFSDPSLPAITLAARAATELQGELVVVHSIEEHPVVIYGVVIPTVTQASAIAHLSAAERRLDDALLGLGVRAKSEIRIGPPGPALLDAAKVFDAELLVVGTHGRTGLTRFFLGSVAEAVLHRAPCSVLVARLA